MAAPPPRKNSTSTAIGTNSVKQSATPLQILLQMGFSNRRAERALAATGNRGVQLAADWLLAHVNDPTLDSGTPREYVLYLCPIGVLVEHLEQFFMSSLFRCGRNGSHNQLPHVTLCSFFKAPDDAVPSLCEALRTVLEQFQQDLPEKLNLDLYSSPNFLGLFIADDQADVLRKLAVQYVKEVSKFNVVVEPASKALHLTLAYQFATEHFSVLDELAREIDRDAVAGWELRIYSRDPRISGHEVHRVIYSHVPQEADELELLIGDFVYVDAEHLTNSPDGWVDGTSWLSGNTGCLPKNYIEQTAETDAWTLHRAMLCAKGPIVDDLEQLNVTRRPPLSQMMRNRTETSAFPTMITEQSTNSKVNPMRSVYENVDLINVKKPSTSQSNEKPKKPRQLLVVRHGERVDFTFGTWIPFSFDDKGNYVRKDLNMPRYLRPRNGGHQNYYQDSPLTEIGLRQAAIIGEAMKDNNVSINYVYCSPSLRCVQTCSNILKGLGEEDIPMNIEPGLFEWFAWYQDKKPTWMTIQELKEWGFNIESHYKPFIAIDELHDSQESSEQYYMRSFYVAQCVLKSTIEKGGNVLLVGHAATLDTCTRQLCGANPRNASELSRLVHKIPYCSVSVAEEESDGGTWKLVAPPFPGIMHAANLRYDWKVLQG